MAGKKTAAKDKGRRRVAENRKARHNFLIEDVIEAGIMLAGSEVKSLREGQANIAESYADVKPDAVWLINAYIPEYRNAGVFAHDARRPRKLLLHKKEIEKLRGKVLREGMTLVPLNMYFNERGMVKIELALARGKRLVDKRQTEKTRDWERQKARLLRDLG